MGYSHHNFQTDSDHFNEAAHGGLIVDLSAYSQRKTPKQGYIFNSDYRLNSPFTRQKEREEVESLRNGVSRPHILGSFNAPQGIIVPKQDGIMIKPSGDMYLYLPDYYDFALPIVALALKDALSLYGEKKFEAANVMLAVKHSNVEAESAHRAEFSEWHDHYNGTKFKTDLIYSFHTTLPTQFKHDGKIWQPPENTIIRFGGEELHRSTVNCGARTGRLWGSIIIEEKENYRNSPHNLGHIGEHDPLFEQFMKAATRLLRNDSSVNALPRPIALMDFEGALQLET